MYDDGRSPINPWKIIIVMFVALIIVIGATIALNGGLSTESTENNNTANNSNIENITTVQSTVIGNTSEGTVTKFSSYGNTTSNIHIALIVGLDQRKQGSNAVIPTLTNSKNLKYSYDVYEINVTNNSNVNSTNDTGSTTLSNRSESLANEYVVPDIINNNYNFTVDIHGTNDSNSYVFVPSEDTFTSKEVLNNVSNISSVGKYTPNSYSFADYLSIPLISNNIPSMVYVSNQYYSNSTSSEISSVISAIDHFDFEHLLNGDVTNNTSNDSYNSSDDINNETNESSNSSISNGNIEIR